MGRLDLRRLFDIRVSYQSGFRYAVWYDCYSLRSELRLGSLRTFCLIARIARASDVGVSL